jgi:GNAT superfamily N-acetyltransferase
VILRRVHDVDGYPSVWPSDPIRRLTGDEDDLGAWIADQDGPPLGHVGLSPAATQPAAQVPGLAAQRPVQQRGLVVRAFIAPDARGAGVGRRLPQQAVDAAHHRGLWPVRDVRQAGRPGASRLCATAGWRRVGEMQRRPSSEIVSPFDSWIGPGPEAGD